MSFQSGNYVFRRKDIGTFGQRQTIAELLNYNTPDNGNIPLLVNSYEKTNDNIFFILDGEFHFSKGSNFKLATEKEVKEHKLKNLFNVKRKENEKYK
jgi:hypothetical protein